MVLTSLPLGSDRTPKTAFGNVSVAQESLKVQLRFPNSINPDIIDTRVNNAAGSVTASGGLATVSTGAASSSLAGLFSRRSLRYEPGIGVTIKATGIFTTGVANSLQCLGYGSEEDGFFFGFSGTSFGVLRRVGGIDHIEKFTITTGATTSTGDITINLDGDATTVAVTETDTTADIARLIKATDFSQVGDGWKVFIAGSILEFTSTIPKPRSGTFSLVDTDTTGTVGAAVTLVEGITPTDNFTAQTAWNTDRMDGSGEINPSGRTIDPTKGNVYKIQFQWLGFGAISYFVENEETGNFELVHIDKYANLNTVPSINDPTLPLCIFVENTSNTTDITVSAGSMSGVLDGQATAPTVIHSESNAKSLTTTETSIITYHVRPVFNSLRSRSSVEPLFLTLASDGNKLATFRVYENAILGGSPTFTDFATTTSIMAFDVAGTTVSEGNKVATFVLGKTDALEVDMTSLLIDLHPGDSLTITGEFFTAGSGDLAASLTWGEFL